MSDAKAKDQGEQQHANMEARRLHAPDLQTVRLSGHVEMSRVEQDRTNASDGSLRHYQPTNLAGRKLPTDWHEQNRSLELQDGEISISRVNPLKEANLISRDKRNANGKPYQVYTAESSQAIQKPGEISKELTQGEYQSETKLSVQITNVPEVSSGLNPQYAVKYVSAAMDAGVVAVRQVEDFMMEPSAINNVIENTANHLKQSPFQFEEDTLEAIHGVVDKLDKPMTAEQRAGIEVKRWLGLSSKLRKSLSLRTHIADCAESLAPEGKAGLDLRRPDGSVLRAVPIPVKFRFDADAPKDRPHSIHFKNTDADNNRITKSDVPIGTKVWFGDEWLPFRDSADGKGKLRVVI